MDENANAEAAAEDFPIWGYKADKKEACGYVSKLFKTGGLPKGWADSPADFKPAEADED